MAVKNLVVQHNKIVEARYKLTVEEQRLLKTLVSKIQLHDEDFKVYEITVLELANLIGIVDDYYYSRVKAITKKLRDSSLNFMNDKGEEVQTGWLSSAKYYKGVVKLRFDPELKPYLLQLKNYFTSYELGNILRLKGMYSIRIYELLKQYERIGKREFTIDLFRQTLNIENEYQQYRDLKKFVLSPAEKEITEKTDISYQLSEVKQGRKVVGLVFEIKAKPIISVDGAAKRVAALPVSPAGPLYEKLVDLGVTRRTAQKIVADYGEESIKAAIDYTLIQQKAGKVTSPGGFVVEAIKNEYRDSKAEQHKRKLRDKVAKEAQDEQAMAQKKAIDQQRKQAIEEYLAGLSENQFKALESEFLETYADNKLFMTKYNQQGLRNPMVKGCFGDYVLKQKLAG
jgi:hypothetical protein